MLLIPDTPVKLPILSIDIPLFAFFAVTPFIIFGVHLNLLLNLLAHSKKLHRWLSQAPGSVEEKADMLRPFLFNQMAIPPQKGWRRFSLPAFLVQIIMFHAPLISLLVFQVRFSDYHSMAMTGWHLTLVGADLLLLLWLQPNILNPKNFHERKLNFRNLVRQLWPKRLGYMMFLLLCMGYAIDNVNLLLEVMRVEHSENWEREFGRNHRFPGDLFYVPREIEIIEREDSFVYNGQAYHRSRWDSLSKRNKWEREYPKWWASIDYGPKTASFRDTVFGLNIWTLRHKPKIDVVQTNLMKNKLPPELVVQKMIAEDVDAKTASRNLRLSFVDGVDLRNRHLSHANLSGCTMDKADLRGACFDNANLSNVSMQKAIATRATFIKADLNKSNLNKSVLVSSAFDHADLEDTEMENIRAKKCTFRNAYLSRTSLTNSYLEDANMRDVRAFSAKMGACFLRKVNFKEAILNDVVLSGSDLSVSDLTAANLSGSWLTGASLQNATLDGTNFDGCKGQLADFSYSKMSGCSFVQADLRGATFESGKVKNTNFSYADLSLSHLPNEIAGCLFFKTTISSTYFPVLDPRSIQYLFASKDSVGRLFYNNNLWIHNPIHKTLDTSILWKILKRTNFCKNDLDSSVSERLQNFGRYKWSILNELKVSVSVGSFFQYRHQNTDCLRCQLQPLEVFSGKPLVFSKDLSDDYLWALRDGFSDSDHNLLREYNDKWYLSFKQEDPNGLTAFLKSTTPAGIDERDRWYSNDMILEVYLKNFSPAVQKEIKTDIKALQAQEKPQSKKMIESPKPHSYFTPSRPE